MLALFTHVWFLLSELLRAPLDAILGKRRRSYTVSLGVEAPKPVTWAVASAHDLRLEGVPPIEVRTAPDPARPGVFKGELHIGEMTLPMAYRVLDERPGEAMSFEVLKAESAPECCPGDDYVCAFAVAGDEARSVITSTYELTHTRFSSRLLMPIAAIQNIRRLKFNAELRAGKRRDDPVEQVKAAVITGLLTFASFFALFGLADAAALIVVILIHELGHVIAMRSAGIPVKGLYFVPFFGGVAIAADRYRSEAERGYVALMGPAFSMTTTTLFWSLAAGAQDNAMHVLAFLGALVNAFNLLPILPLDGGHVAGALSSRFGIRFQRGFHVAGLLAGVLLALLVKSALLLFLVLLIAYSTARQAKRGTSLHLVPLSWQQWAFLLVGYAATIAFYVFAIASLAGGISAGLGALPSEVTN